MKSTLKLSIIINIVFQFLSTMNNFQKNKFCKKRFSPNTNENNINYDKIFVQKYKEYGDVIIESLIKNINIDNKSNSINITNNQDYSEDNINSFYSSLEIISFSYENYDYYIIEESYIFNNINHKNRKNKNENSYNNNGVTNKGKLNEKKL